MSDEPYRPIACGLHDVLEAHATRRHRCRLRHHTEHGERVAEGVITDIYARAGVEYLRLDDGTEIRLDRITSIDGQPFRTPPPRHADG